MITEYSTEKFLSSICSAALESDDWASVLDQYRVRMKGVASRLLIGAYDSRWSQADSYFAGTYDAEAHGRYVSYYHTLDPRPAALAKIEAGTVVTSQQLFGDEFMRRSEFYNDFIVPGGGHHGLCCQLIRTHDLWVDLFVARDARQGPFDAEEVKLTNDLIPYLRGAARISAVSRHWNLVGRFSMYALEQLSKGVAIADQSGKILYMNRTAAKFIAREDGLLLRSDGLLAVKAAERTRLTQLIQAVGSAPKEDVPRALDIAISRGKNRLPYLVSIAPLVGDKIATELRQSVKRAAVLIMIVDPMPSLDRTAERLTMVYGLTKAEARLGAEILQGKQLAAIAPDLGLSMSTLRTQMRAILKKTGTSRQSEFVRIAALLSTVGSTMA